VTTLRQELEVKIFLVNLNVLLFVVYAALFDPYCSLIMFWIVCQRRSCISIWPAKGGRVWNQGSPIHDSENGLNSRRNG
jgi:hypothetical protein